MKRIDFHLHTVSAKKDHTFEFDIEKLVEHVTKYNLDAIAITNHNLFEENNYNEIVSEFKNRKIDCKVFPGVELDALNSHLLIIVDPEEIPNLIYSLNIYNERNYSRGITKEQLVEIFPNLSKYIVIPHYKKNPCISDSDLDSIKEYVTAVEVSSPKKFLVYNKMEDFNFPVVCFTDCRFGDNAFYSAKAIYIDVDKLELPNIMKSIKSGTQISINEYQTSNIELEPGVIASNNLNLIIGKRSSGKSVTLDRIASMFDNSECYYVDQGQIINDAKKDIFEDKQNKSATAKKTEYYNKFSLLAETAIDFGDTQTRLSKISSYLDDLKEYAKTSSEANEYSKCTLFSCNMLDDVDTSDILLLIESVKNLLKNVTYKNIIDSHIDRASLLNLLTDLLKIAKSIFIKAYAVKFSNDVIENIKKDLSAYSSQSDKPLLNFADVALKEYFFNRLYLLIEATWVNTLISEENLGKFKIRFMRKRYSSVNELKKSLNAKREVSFSGIDFDNSRNYVDFLIEKSEIGNIEKGFFNLDISIVDEFDHQLSTGQRAEFVFLNHIEKSKSSAVVLFDEPESSFDNIFLSSSIKKAIKDLAEHSTVFVSTHNQVLGLSLDPNKVFYTKYDLANDVYKIYSGEIVDEHLIAADGDEESTKDTLLDMFEAGEISYYERKKIYEDTWN